MAGKSSTVSKAVKKTTGKQKPIVSPRSKAVTPIQPKVKLNVKKETSRLKTDAKRQVKILNALYEIADAASAVRDMQSFYKKLHKIVGKLMYAENLFIALHDKQTDLITWPYYVDTVDEQPAPTKLQDHLGATGWVLRHGETVADADGSWAAAKARGEAHELSSDSDGIAVPLKVKNETIGVVLIQSYIKGIGYQPEDIKVLEFVAQHIATALTRARAIEETRQRNAELAIINSVQDGLASKLDMQEIYDLVGNKIQEIFDAQIVVIGVQSNEGIAYFPFAIDHGQRIQLEPIGLEPVGEYLMRHRQPLLTNMERDGAKYGRENGAKSFLAVPMFVGEEFRGAISLQNVDHENAFSDSDVHLLSTLTSSMSVALESARLFDETQHLLKVTEDRAAELAVINSIQQGLAAELDFQAIVDLVGDKLREVFNTDDLGIRWYDEKTNLVHFLYEYEHGKRLIIPSTKPPTGGCLKDILKTRKPVVRNTRAEYQPGGHISGTDLSNSLAAIPIISSDRVIGAFTARKLRTRERLRRIRTAPADHHRRIVGHCA